MEAYLPGAVRQRHARRGDYSRLMRDGSMHPTANGRCQLPPSGRNGNGSAPCALDGGEGKSEKGTPAKPPIGFCGTPGSSKSMNPPPPPPTGGPPAAGTPHRRARCGGDAEIVSAVRRRRRRRSSELAEPSRLFCWTFALRSSTTPLGAEGGGRGGGGGGVGRRMRRRRRR